EQLPSQEQAVVAALRREVARLAQRVDQLVGGGFRDAEAADDVGDGERLARLHHQVEDADDAADRTRAADLGVSVARRLRLPGHGLPRFQYPGPISDIPADDGNPTTGTVGAGDASVGVFSLDTGALQAVPLTHLFWRRHSVSGIVEPCPKYRNGLDAD